MKISAVMILVAALAQSALASVQQVGADAAKVAAEGRRVAERARHLVLSISSCESINHLGDARRLADMTDEQKAIQAEIRKLDAIIGQLDQIASRDLSGEGLMLRNELQQHRSQLDRDIQAKQVDCGAGGEDQHGVER